MKSENTRQISSESNNNKKEPLPHYYDGYRFTAEEFMAKNWGSESELYPLGRGFDISKHNVQKSYLINLPESEMHKLAKMDGKFYYLCLKYKGEAGLA